MLIIVGLFLLIRGATTDISVPSPINDFLSSRIVNYDLMFSALSSEITGGFILLVGAIFLSTAAILKCKKNDTSD